MSKICEDTKEMSQSGNTANSRPPKEGEIMNKYSQHRPRGYKTLFMLNSTEHENCPANKSQIINNCKFVCLC